MKDLKDAAYSQHERETHFMKLLQGFIMSIGMFSIIPVPIKSWNDKSLPIVLPTLPLVGAIIGAIWYGLSYLLSLLFLPLMLESVVVLFIPLVLSGCIHLDGYMDTADAVLSRRDLEEKKRILKDPHTGAFAVIALIILLLFQFSAVYTITDAQKGLLIFIFIPIISRCIAGIAGLNLKLISETGINASFKNGSKTGHTIFTCIVLLICCTAAWFILGLSMLPLLVEAVIGVIAVWYLYKQFKGISGDLCGCVITVSELSALICFALL